MKKHICRVVLVVAIATLMITFAGSAEAAGRRHHRHQQSHHHSGVARASYAPRIHAVPNSNFSGYGSYRTNQSGYGVPHHDFHHDYFHHDYYHDSYHGYHHGR